MNLRIKHKITAENNNQGKILKNGDKILRFTKTIGRTYCPFVKKQLLGRNDSTTPLTPHQLLGTSTSKKIQVIHLVKIKVRASRSGRQTDFTKAVHTDTISLLLEVLVDASRLGISTEVDCIRYNQMITRYTH